MNSVTLILVGQSLKSLFIVHQLQPITLAFVKNIMKFFVWCLVPSLSGEKTEYFEKSG